ncbi:MAG: hypothetical protein N3A54_00975, partial [Patescibacteria group bacterium]|nr:hypothetical protein [Patescibacteria group bacterium]
TIESEKGKINNVTRKFSEKITDEKEKQEFVEAFDKAVDFSIKLMDKIKNSAYEWRKFAFRHLGGNNFTPQNVKVMVDFLDEYYLQVLSYYQGVNKLALADKMSSDTNYMHFMQSSLRKIAKAKKTLRDYVDGKSPSTNDIDEANDIILGSSSFLLLSFFAHKSNLITDKYDRFLVYLTEKVRIAYRIFFKYYSSQHKETGGTKLSSDVMKFGEVEEVFKMLDEGLFSSNVLGVSATI